MQTTFEESLELSSINNISVTRNNNYDKSYIEYSFNQNAKPIEHMLVDTTLGEKLSAYNLIEKDLNSAFSTFSYLIDFISKTSKEELQGYGGHSNNNFIIGKSLHQSAIVTYCKCFANSSGGKKSKQKPRGVKLEKKLLNDFPDELKAAHEDLMEMRNEYIAHGGASPYEKCVSLVLLSKNYEINSEILCLEAHSGGLNVSFYHLVLKLISSLKGKLIEMQNKKRKTLYEGYLKTLPKEKIREKATKITRISLSGT